MAAATAAIVGAARNVRAHLPNALRVMRRVGELHFPGRFRLLVFEDGSTDGTREYLAAQPDVALLGGPSPQKGGRTVRLAAARNALMAAAAGTDVVVAFDMDDVLVGFDAASVQSSLGLLSQFDGVGANSSPVYYDMWALRTADDWMPGDYRTVGLRGRARSIPAGAPPVPVMSCFGGAMVYRTAACAGCRYEGTAPGGREEVCEHVPFHAQMARRGGRLCINPAMLVRAPHEHARTVRRLGGLPEEEPRTGGEPVAKGARTSGASRTP